MMAGTSPWAFGCWLPALVLPAAPDGLSLVPALQARMESIEELVAALPGGIFFGPPDEEADDNPPYSSWLFLGEVPWYDTGGMDGKAAQFRMRLVGYDPAELERIHEEIWEVHFHPQMEPLAIRYRRFCGLWDGTAHVEVGVIPSPLGASFSLRWWDFTVYTAVERLTA